MSARTESGSGFATTTLISENPLEAENILNTARDNLRDTRKRLFSRDIQLLKAIEAGETITCRIPRRRRRLQDKMFELAPTIFWAKRIQHLPIVNTTAEDFILLEGRAEAVIKGVDPDVGQMLYATYIASMVMIQEELEKDELSKQALTEIK